MARILIEYNDVPGVISVPEADTIRLVKFISVYTYGDDNYIRKESDTFESAFLSFSNEWKAIIFAEIEYTNESEREITRRVIKFDGFRFEVEDSVVHSDGDFFYFIDYSGDRFELVKSRSNNLFSSDIVYKTFYKRSVEIGSDWYDLIPAFNDIYLETLFILCAMCKRNSISSCEELEAYMLQAKSRYLKMCGT